MQRSETEFGYWTKGHSNIKYAVDSQYLLKQSLDCMIQAGVVRSSVLHRAGPAATGRELLDRTENFITSRSCWPATFGPVEYILKRIFASRISAQAGGFLPRNCPRDTL